MTQRTTSRDLITLVMTEVMTLAKIDHKKLTVFGKLQVGVYHDRTSSSYP